MTVCMTAEAQQFITPLTFEALSGRPVRTGIFELVETSDPQHIGLTERADLMLVAPATANIIAKVSHGLCDDLVSLMIKAAAACPVVFAPAMNNRMGLIRSPRKTSRSLTVLVIASSVPNAVGWHAETSVAVA